MRRYTSYRILYKGIIKEKYSLNKLSTFIFLVLLVVESHESLEGEETDSKMLEARDDVRTDDVCVRRVGTRDFLLQFLHDSII